MKSVLVVEDEPCLIEIARIALESQGHHVTTAANGDDAIKAAFEAAQPIDFLVCDLVIPGARAAEVVHAVRRLHPAARVLIMTGYPLETLAEHDIDGACLLLKPFNVSQLARCATCKGEVHSCDRTRKGPQSDFGTPSPGRLGSAG